MYIQLKIDAPALKEIKRIIKETIKEVMKEFKNAKESSIATDSEDKLLTRDEVMKMLGVSHSTLYHYQKNQIIPFLKIGNRVYFKKKDILENIDLEG
jgi:excisionase family DNA binding protein